MPTRRTFFKWMMGLSAFFFPGLLGLNLNGLLQTGPGRASVQETAEAGEQTSAASVSPADSEILKRQAMDDILTLSKAYYLGRKAGSVGEARSASYLMAQFRGLGLEPLGDLMDQVAQTQNQRNYLQAFTVYPVKEEYYGGRLTFRPGNPEDLRTPCVNVLGGIMGENREESVIISAHFDHLGIFNDHLYPGANDNASGVGSVLDVMRRLVREGVKPKCNIVAALWSAEEMGFVGSFSFLKEPTVPLKGIRAVFNMDTVGNGDLNKFSLWAAGHNVAVQAIQEAAREVKAEAVLTPSEGYDSDQFYFAESWIPAVTLMASAWLDKNHTPEDVPSLVNPNKVALASEILYRAVLRCAVAEGAPKSAVPKSAEPKRETDNKNAKVMPA